MKKHLKDWLEALAYASAILIIMFLFFWPMKVDGSSMENTFFDNDRVVLSRIYGFMNEFEKGDIVVFDHMDEDKEINVVKRIIADENDTIKIQGQDIWVNGQLLSEDYITGLNDKDIEMVVPKGEIFVIGDNREKSHDSRDFGTISKTEVSGKIILKIYPFDEISIVNK